MIDIDKIYETVNFLIKKFDTSDPKIICKRLNILIEYKDLGDIKGYYISCLQNKIIVIDEKLDEEKKALVIAHELGHAILHCDRNIQCMRNLFIRTKNTKYEYEANIFAALLLEKIDFRDYESENLEYCINEYTSF